MTTPEQLREAHHRLAQLVAAAEVGMLDDMLGEERPPARHPNGTLNFLALADPDYIAKRHADDKARIASVTGYSQQYIANLKRGRAFQDLVSGYARQMVREFWVGLSRQAGLSEGEVIDLGSLSDWVYGEDSGS